LVLDVVIYSKFHRNPFRGFGATRGGGGENFPFSLLCLLAVTIASTMLQAVSAQCTFHHDFPLITVMSCLLFLLSYIY